MPLFFTTPNGMKSWSIPMMTTHWSTWILRTTSKNLWMRSMELATYSLILILIRDIELSDEIRVKRLVFNNFNDCIRIAQALDQVRDPIARKKQCRTNFTYER